MSLMRPLRVKRTIVGISTQDRNDGIHGEPCWIEGLLRCIRREGRHFLAWASPAQRRRWALWLSEQGPAFLCELGIRQGDTVLDVGCGRGAYALPAARQAGDSGLVVAEDALVGEIVATGFHLRERREVNLWHGHDHVRGRVLNFRKE